MRNKKENKMTTLKLDFATHLSEEELKELRQYVYREFNYRLEDKLILVLSDWLKKAKETIEMERQVVIDMKEVRAIMKAKKEAGVKIHEGGYPSLEILSKEEYDNLRKDLTNES